MWGLRTGRRRSASAIRAHAAPSGAAQGCCPVGWSLGAAGQQRVCAEARGRRRRCRAAAAAAAARQACAASFRRGRRGAVCRACLARWAWHGCAPLEGDHRHGGAADIAGANAAARVACSESARCARAQSADMRNAAQHSPDLANHDGTSALVKHRWWWCAEGWRREWRSCTGATLREAHVAGGAHLTTVPAGPRPRPRCQDANAMGRMPRPWRCCNSAPSIAYHCARPRLQQQAMRTRSLDRRSLAITQAHRWQAAASAMQRSMQHGIGSMHRSMHRAAAASKTEACDWSPTRTLPQPPVAPACGPPRLRRPRRRQVARQAQRPRQ